MNFLYEFFCFTWQARCFFFILCDINFTFLILVSKAIIALPKDENIDFDGYIGTWVLRIYKIYRRYIDEYFYINIDN